MVGHPIFKLNDKVIFDVQGVEHKGKVRVIDSYGVFEDASDVHYDIEDLVENIFWKHIRQDSIRMPGWDKDLYPEPEGQERVLDDWTIPDIDGENNYGDGGDTPPSGAREDIGIIFPDDGNEEEEDDEPTDYTGSTLFPPTTSEEEEEKNPIMGGVESNDTTESTGNTPSDETTEETPEGEENVEVGGSE